MTKQMSIGKQWAVLGIFFLLLFLAGTQSLLVKYANYFVLSLLLGCFFLVIYLGSWKKVERDDSDIG